MSTSTWNENEARVDWRRVGAMSTAFNLHIVAGAALLLATAHVPPPLVAADPPDMEVIFVDPEPIQPPPPIRRVELEPEVQPVQPVRAPQRLTSIDTAAPIRPVPGPSTAVQPTMPARIEAILPAPSTQLDRGVGYERVRQPQYPIEARRLGIEGETLLRVLVGSDGQVLEIGIARSSGDRHLDRAALSAVRSWRFQPAIESGRPVTAWVQVPITFRIGNH